MATETRSIKPARIKKNNNIKPSFTENKFEYDAWESVDPNQMHNPDVINGLVKNISKLDKEGHMEIYKTIRKFKPATFFATNSLGTHFNILSLSGKELWEVNRIVMMSSDNSERSEVMSKWTTEVQCHRPDSEKQDVYVEQVNPSEQVKMQQMYRMNNDLTT